MSCSGQARADYGRAMLRSLAFVTPVFVAALAATTSTAAERSTHICKYRNDHFAANFITAGSCAVFRAETHGKPYLGAWGVPRCAFQALPGAKEGQGVLVYITRTPNEAKWWCPALAASMRPPHYRRVSILYAAAAAAQARGPK